MKTTFRKLIEGIDFSNKQIQSEVDWEELSRILNVEGLYYSNDERLKAYHVKTWYCTDSYVGIRVYFLDNKPVAISNQNGRKSSEDFGFISKEVVKEVRDYLFSLVEENDFTQVDILDGLDDEIPSTYKIEYNSQILHKTALLDGKRVAILKKNFESEGYNSPNYFHTVQIQHENGEKAMINCKLLDFEYNTLD